MIIFDVIPFLPKRHRKSHLDPQRFGNRIKAFKYLFYTGFAVIVARIITLSLHTTLPSDKISSYFDCPPVIKDKNGHILATSVPTFSLYLNASNLPNSTHTKKIIKDIFPEINHSFISKKIDEKSSFIWIKRHITPSQKEEVLHHGLVGAFFKNDFKRVYPMQNITSHVIGFRNIDNLGALGLEMYLDALEQKPEALHTTLDIRIQSIVHQALQSALEKFKAKSAGAILINIENGEILSLCSLPDFDPNISENLQGDALFNNILQGTYELGSIMKIITFAQAFNENLVQDNEVLNTNRSLSVGGFVIKDHYPKPYNQTVVESFINSSNIGSTEVFSRFREHKQLEFWNNIDLFKPIQIEINEASQPTQVTSTSFIKGLTASYGYGISVPPLRFLMATSGILKGYYIQPTLIQQKSTHKHFLPINEQTQNKIKSLLYTTAVKGTAKKAQYSPYLIGGKTGSSKKRSGAKGYDQNAHCSFFVAFFPINQPKFALFILLDEPVGTKDTFFFASSGWTAAPLAQKIIKKAGPLLGLEHLAKEQIADANKIFLTQTR